MSDLLPKGGNLQNVIDALGDELITIEGDDLRQEFHGFLFFVVQDCHTEGVSKVIECSFTHNIKARIEAMQRANIGGLYPAFHRVLYVETSVGAAKQAAAQWAALLRPEAQAIADEVIKERRTRLVNFVTYVGDDNPQDQSLRADGSKGSLGT